MQETQQQEIQQPLNQMQQPLTQQQQPQQQMQQQHRLPKLQIQQL